ncbi:MAG: AbrB/MazE/SpoVT family DNA-binding domain-containing protein [Chloroflexota bacterium]
MEAPKIKQARVSAKGWVVIPAALRRRYGLTPGTMVEFREANGKIVIVPQVPNPIETLYGKLAAEPSLTQALLKDREEELEREEAQLRTG